jgi:hypothetical protein
MREREERTRGLARVGFGSSQTDRVRWLGYWANPINHLVYFIIFLEKKNPFKHLRR